MPLFAELRQELDSYLDKDQVDAIGRAFKVAENAHRGQQRKSGEPYISHPLAVARILASMRMDSQSIMAAVLHDVLEDTGITKVDLVAEFGEEVADLVDGVSKLDQIQFESKAEAQAESFRKMLLAMARDIRVILVKLADRLHNMRTLECLPPDKRKRIALETLEIYAPIANRLGMHNFRVEFEDLGFAALYPLRYRILKNAVQKARGNRKEILSIIKSALRNCLEQHGIPPSAVIGRQKHLYSIYQKMRHKHLPFADIMDVYAFRIVVADVDTCYRVLGAVHNLYKPVPERFKDYIAIPKSNGYQSLHTTLFGPYGVPVEIQIRTEEMDQKADNGIAAHWLYKSEDSTASDAEMRTREWLKGLLDMQHSTGTSIEFIENVKIDLFPDEVYVFTPKGKILELPNGATPIDFAYAVHSDIGNSCVAVKINRRLSPLSAPLKNGQTVEIITMPGACPNPDWLNFVVTGKARSNIRHFQKSQLRAASIALGQQLLSNALAMLGVTWGQLVEKMIKHVLHDFHYKTVEDLCEAVGLGEQSPLVVARKLTGIEEDVRIKTVAMPLLIKGTEGMAISFAKCCRPIPGDPIVGIVSAGHGIVIHLEQCHNVEHYRAGSKKIIPVRWEESVVGEFKADIHVELVNQRGALARLTAAIAEADANIEDINSQDHDGRYSSFNITITVRNRAHLARVMRRVRAIKVVTRLMRSRG